MKKIFKYIGFFIVFILIIVILSFIVGAKRKFVFQPVISTDVYTGTIEQLMDRGGNYHCTYSVGGSPSIDIPGGRGEVYITGTKARANIQNDGAWSSGYMSYKVRRGDNIYNWFGLPMERISVAEIFRYIVSATYITKLSFKEELIPFNEFKAGFNSDGTQKYIKIDKEKVEFTCESWGPQNTLFLIPPHVSIVTSMVELIK